MQTSPNHSIHHCLEIEASPTRLFDALTRPDQLAAWWTPRVERQGEGVGAVLQFRFGDGGGPDMRVDAQEEGRLVQWHCVAGPWQGMTFRFALAPHARGVVLRFDHSGWSEQSDFFGHCNAKWGYFLAVSLKRYLETGEGAPHPRDPKI